MYLISQAVPIKEDFDFLDRYIEKANKAARGKYIIEHEWGGGEYEDILFVYVAFPIGCNMLRGCSVYRVV